MKKPVISVVMSVYNDASYIRESIESVLKQSYTNWEFIIVDDASTDASPSIIRDFKRKDNRIIFYQFKSNRGAPIALNKGIEMASGKFIARIDSDDVWLDSDKLMKQLKIMQSNPKLAFIGTWAKVIDTKNKELFELNYPSEYQDIKNQMLRHNCFVSSSIMFKKKLLDENTKYGAPGRYAEDYGLWLKLGTKGEFINIPEYMTGYRINPKGISQTKYKSQVDATLRMISENKNNYPNYIWAFSLWSIRKYYPNWFRGELSKKIKGVFPSF